MIPHFKARFSDQEWVLFDPQRAYGFYYDLKEVISFTPAEKNFGKTAQLSDGYEQLWKPTFSISISLKLQKHSLPNSEACPSGIGSICLRQNNPKILSLKSAEHLKIILTFALFYG